MEFLYVALALGLFLAIMEFRQHIAVGCIFIVLVVVYVGWCLPRIMYERWKYGW